MSEMSYPLLGETVCRETLPNGLKVAVVPRRGFTRKLAYFVTDFGSVHNRFVLDGKTVATIPGIAHFLEHKLFELPGERDVSGEFAAMGASVNAFTSFDMTAYYFTCTEHFSDCLRLLLEFVSTPYFPEESVLREQGIIDQEIDMNEDDPDSVVFQNLVASMYRDHPVRIPILGASEDIHEITSQDLYTCHRAFYTPENMMLCVVGDVELEEVCAIAREVLPEQRIPAATKLPFDEEPPRSMADRVSRPMQIDTTTFLLGFKCDPLGRGEEAVRQELMADLAADALFGESSPLYQELYSQGLIDSSFGGGFESVDGCAMLTCGGDSRDPEAVRQRMLRAVRTLPELTEEDFLRLKRSAMGRRIKALDSFDATCFRLCAYAAIDFDYFRFPELYQKMERQELTDFLKTMIRPERSVLSVAVPRRKEHDN